MSNRSYRSVLAGLAATLTLSSSAGALPASYFSVPAFVAGFGSTASNSLNALGPGSTLIPFGVLGTGALTGAFLFPPILPNPGSAFSITFSQLINGFGADFSADGTSNPSAPLEVRLQFFNGATPVGGSEFGNFGTTFLGARPCCGAFDRVEISVGTQYSGGFVFMDNPIIGVDAAAVVTPEPATLALVASGLALVGAAARRRQRPTA
jgi:hypothetical protein